MLSEQEIARRARTIELVITDCDGVLTDGGVYVTGHGELFKRFSVRDGMGVERLRSEGIKTAIVTREDSPIVLRRGEKLGLELIYLAVVNKEACLPAILRDAAVLPDSVAYIGDDVNDVGIMQAIGSVGLTGSPADAIPEVHEVSHYRCKQSGGSGAFREFAEWVLRQRGGSPWIVQSE